MKKLITAVVLTTAMGTASAGFFGSNNYGNNGNGFFGFNPYSFMEPRWFIQEAGNFIDEFDSNNYGYNGYNGNSNSYNVHHSLYRNTANPAYNKNYVKGLASYYSTPTHQR